MVCVYTVVGKNILLVQFEDGHKKEIIFCSLQYFFSKEEVGLDMDEPVSNLSEKEQGELLTIDGDTDVEETCMLERGMYLSVFYCFCFVKDILTDMLEE